MATQTPTTRSGKGRLPLKGGGREGGSGAFTLIVTVSTPVSEEPRMVPRLLRG